MEWTRSETLALAAPACNICLGLGLRIGRSEATHPCNCVLRAIFRACFDRFRDCVSREKYLSRVTLDPLPGKERRGTWGRKDEEYSADFCLVSKRARNWNTAFSAITFCWGRIGSCAATSCRWIAATFSTRCTGLNRSWAGCFANWNRMRYFRSTSISTDRRKVFPVAWKNA
jgi:hypothetical protein